MRQYSQADSTQWNQKHIRHNRMGSWSMRESAVGEQMMLELGEEKMTLELGEEKMTSAVGANCHQNRCHRQCNVDLIAIFSGWNDMEKKYQTLTSETTE